MKRILRFSLLVSALYLTACKKDCKVCNDAAFSKVFGGSATEGFYSIVVTSDGGYLMAGWTTSNDGQVSGAHGREDAWIVKIDCNGELVWQKTYGGTDSDAAYSIVAAPDGGFLVAAGSYSNDGDVSGLRGSQDFWVFKIDDKGKLLWSKTYGGSGSESAQSILLARDGYLVAGNTSSNNGDVTGYQGNTDPLVIKIDGNGNKLWAKTFGNSSFEVNQGLARVEGGNFILHGYMSVTTKVLSDDAYLTKIDGDGNKLWQKTYGGSRTDLSTTVTLSPDLKYVVGGFTRSDDGDVVGKQNGTSTSDAWILKLQPTGDIIWQKTFAIANADYQVRSIVNAPGGGYAVAGGTPSNTASVPDDGYILKLDGSGNQVWRQSFGGTRGESFFNLINLPSGGYAAVGGSSSNDGSISGNHGAQDAWVVRVNRY